VFAFLKAQNDVQPRECADILLIDQYHRSQAGDSLPVEVYLQEFPAVASDPELKLDLVFCELLNVAQKKGEAPDIGRFIARFPDLGEALIRQSEVADWLASSSGSTLMDAAVESVVDRDDALLTLAVRMDFVRQDALDALRKELDHPEA